MKAGDRYKHIADKDYMIYEYTGNGEECVVVETRGWKLGSRYRWGPGSDEYLGNFSKSNNFTTLYGILAG